MWRAMPFQEPEQTGIRIDAIEFPRAAQHVPAGADTGFKRIWCVTGHRRRSHRFQEPLDNSPMTFPLSAGEVETPAVKNFKATGVNEYRGNADAIAEGKKLYTENCIVCHGADGTGKMGPTLVGKDVVYPQALADPGMFSIIYGGASGAMQSFARRGMQQDQMLKIIAYVRSLDK
jgi:cytochrome c-L